MFEGQYNFPMEQIEAGQEFELQIELPWYNDDLTRDFSVVTWSEKEPVTIKHVDGLESDHWPLQGNIPTQEEEVEEEEIVPEPKPEPEFDITGY